MYESTETTYYAPTPEEQAREWIAKAMLAVMEPDLVASDRMNYRLEVIQDIASKIFNVPLSTLQNTTKST